MRIGLVGFGKTGRSVASVVLNEPEMSLEWVVRRSEKLQHRSVPEFFGVDAEDPGIILSASEMSADELLDHHPVDTIIDFSSEEGLDYYGSVAAERGVNVVTAISHYSIGQQVKLRRLSERTAVLWSPNITVGINFLILAAQSLRRIAPHTDIEIIEEHFKTKSGVSGTAKLIGQALDVAEEDIKSVRAGGIIGVHEILFGFPYQVVRLRHESITRDAFGDGASFAAKRLQGLAPGLYTMQDLMLPMFSAPPVPSAAPKRVLRQRPRRFSIFGVSKVSEPQN